jgi:hypothetical protein
MHDSAAALQATQAAALALWVLLVNWQQPQQAVMMAAGLGGYAATTGTLVGGLAGALHGTDWVPTQWWDHLQEAPAQEQPQPVSTAATGRAAGTGQQAGEQQQQPREQQQADAQEAQQAAAAAAAAADDDGGGGGGQEREGRQLRPASKYSVVVLGHELAGLDCRQPVLL